MSERPEDRDLRVVWPVEGREDRWYSLEEEPPAAGTPVRRLYDILVPVEALGTREVTADDVERLTGSCKPYMVGLPRHEIVWRRATEDEAAPVLAGEAAARSEGDRRSDESREHRTLADVFYGDGELFVTPNGVPGDVYGTMLESDGSSSEFVLGGERDMWWLVVDADRDEQGGYDNPANARRFGYRMAWNDDIAARIRALGSWDDRR